MAHQNESVKRNLKRVKSRDITPATELLSNTGILAKDLAVEILSGGVEDANSILKQCGCTAFIPGTNYGTLRTIADYYHVTKQYVTGVFLRWHITHDASDTVIKESPESFLRNHGTGKCGYRCCNQSFIWIDETTGERKVVSAQGQYYDARAILAFACLAIRSRQISKSSMANQVMGFIENSPYMQAVSNKRMKPNVSDAEQSTEVKQGAPVESTITVSVTDGGISMAHADFMKLMQAIHVNITGKAENAVKAECESHERLQNKSEEAQFRPVPKNAFRTKYTGASYTKMIELYKRNDISGYEAAKALGISAPTFYGIARRFGVRKRTAENSQMVMTQ